MRRSCSICGRVSSIKAMKRLYKKKQPNLILVASLSFLGVVEKQNVDSMVDNISRDKIYICHSHVVRAAQYLCAEVTISGGRLSYDTDLKGRKASAYFTTADIPPHLVEVINGTSSKEVVTARDVWTFVNGALMKYHGTTAWPSDYQEEDESEKAVPNIDTDGPPPLSKAEDELGAEDGVDMANGSSSAAESQLIEQTNSDELKRYYLVHGGLLVTLFRFCPECGHRLSAVQLIAVSTAAVVRFLCEHCHPPVARDWESREGLLDHLRWLNSTSQVQSRRRPAHHVQYEGAQHSRHTSVRATSGAAPISAKVPRIDADQSHHPPIVQQGPCPSESACERLLDHVTVEKAGGEVDGNQVVDETSGLSTVDGEVKAEVTDDTVEDDNYETVRSYIIRQLKLPDPPSHPPAPRENLNPTETELLD